MTQQHQPQILVVAAAPGFFLLELVPQFDGPLSDAILVQPVIAWRVGETGKALPVTIYTDVSADEYAIEHPDSKVSRHCASGGVTLHSSREEWADSLREEAHAAAMDATAAATSARVGAAATAATEDDGIPF